MVIRAAHAGHTGRRQPGVLLADLVDRRTWPRPACGGPGRAGRFREAQYGLAGCS